jgi:hippurate hydrolase
MTGEDFSFMLLQVPGAYGFIGNGLNGLPGINLHTAEYDFNDDNLTIGSQFWDRLVRRWFEKTTGQTA